MLISCIFSSTRTPLIQNTNKHIRLTQDRQSEVGWLWSRMPIRVTNYQVDVEFKVCSDNRFSPSLLVDFFLFC